MIWLLLACARPPDPATPASGDDTGPTTNADDTGITDPWISLPALCEAPASLPEDPLTLVGQARVEQTMGSGFMEALDVAVVGDTTFVTGMGYLMVFDVGDPESPELIFGPDGTGAGKLHKVEPLTTGFIATTDREDGLTIWDAGDPSAMVPLIFLPGSGMEGMSFDGRYLALTVRAEGIRIYDLLDPASPEEVGRAEGLSAPWALAAAGDGWIYAADSSLGVVPIDVSDPTLPLVGEPVDIGAAALHISFAEDRLYVSAGAEGVVVLDATDRAAPAELFRLPVAGSAVDADVEAGRLWVADHEGIDLFDLSTDPPTPVQIESSEQFALAVDAVGDRAFVGDWNLFDVFAFDPTAEAGALDLPSAEIRIEDGAAELTITNRGAGLLTLTGATLDPPASLLVDKSALSPGESAILHIEGATDGATLCLASDDPDGALQQLPLRESAGAPAGVQAPDFALEDLDGTVHRLSEQLGHPVLLAYFATW